MKQKSDKKNKKQRQHGVAQDTNAVTASSHQSSSSANGGDGDQYRSLARALADADKGKRDATIENIYKFVVQREKRVGEFPDLEMAKLWKGLFYCMWMSDKPEIQAELAEGLAQMVHKFKKSENRLSFLRHSFRAIGNEWGGLDRWRIDKFYSLLRKLVRESLKVAMKHKCIDDVNSIFMQDILQAKRNGVALHLCDIFHDELESSGCLENLDSDQVHELFSPFYASVAMISDNFVAEHLMKRVFLPLIEDEENPVAAVLDLEVVGHSLLELGAQREVSSKRRELLYEAHRQFKKTLKKRAHDLQEVSNGQDEEDEQEVVEASDNEDEEDDDDESLNRNLGKEFEKMFSPNDKAKAKKKGKKLGNGQKDESNSTEKKKKSKKEQQEIEEEVSQMSQKNAAELNGKKKDKKKDKKKKEIEEHEVAEKQAVTSTKKKKVKKSKKLVIEAEETIPNGNESIAKKKRKSPSGSAETEEQKRKKKLRFSLDNQELEHHISVKRLRTTPVKPSAKLASPETSLLKVKAIKGARTEPRPTKKSISANLKVARQNTVANTQSAKKVPRKRSMF